jgi:mannosyltransferase PIG-V
MKADPRPAAIEEHEPGPGAGRRRELRDGLVYCLKVFAVARLCTALLALLAVALLPDLSQLVNTPALGIPHPVGVTGWPAHPVTPGWHNLVTAWERFDGLWYLRIASGGYRVGDGSAAFFPLYPLAIRAVSFVLGGHPLAGALVVSNAAFLGALMMLYVLGRSEMTEDAARRAVVYMAVFPTAFFFFAPYTESVFVLLSLACFWGARRRRWEVAGWAGALAALARNIGVLLVLPLAVEALHQFLSSPKPRRLPLVPLACSLGPAAGLGAYLLYWQVRAGDWLAPLHQQANWQRELVNPLSTVARGTNLAFRYIGAYAGGYHQLDWLITVAVVLFAGYAAVKLRPSYGVFTWAGILMPLSYVFVPRPLMSFPRFALPLFPLFWAMARWTDGHRGRHEALLVVSAILLGVMEILFVDWYYIF